MLTDFGPDAEERQGFISSVRERDRSLPIVILSGSYDAKIAYESGANAFVRKPNNLEDFIEKMQAVVKFWLDVAELPSPEMAHGQAA